MRAAKLVLISLLSGCSAASSAGGTGTRPVGMDPDAQALIQAAQGLFVAMEARDTLAIRELFLPDAELIIVRPETGADRMVDRRGISNLITSVATAPEPLRERIWEPKVAVAGPLATLWAPYDFHLGNRFSHCGIDLFQFVRMKGSWKIVTLSYTVETTSCPPPAVDKPPTFNFEVQP